MKQTSQSTNFSLTVSAKARERGESEETVRRKADAGIYEHIRNSAGQRLFKPQQPAQAAQ